MRSIICCVIGAFFDKTSRVCEMLFVLFIMPPSKVLYAHNVKLWYIPPRKSLQRQEQDIKFRVPLHYCAEDLALQFLLSEGRDEGGSGVVCELLE